METIKITPTWVGLLPVLLELRDNGKAEGRRTANEELLRMAQAADVAVNMLAEEEDK